MRRVFADRAAYLAESRFCKCAGGGTDRSLLCEGVGGGRLMRSGRLRAKRCTPVSRMRAVRRRWAAAPSTLVSLGEGPHTTHFSVVDAAGNAVASTYTLNNWYGSHVTSTAGFLLNDEMDDFTTQAGRAECAVRLDSIGRECDCAGAPAVELDDPTILLRDGKLSFVTGSPGGPTIISATLLRRD